jgi:hypothetical protein
VQLALPVQTERLVLMAVLVQRVLKVLLEQMELQV